MADCFIGADNTITSLGFSTVASRAGSNVMAVVVDPYYSLWNRPIG